MKRKLLLCMILFVIASAAYSVPYSTIGYLRAPDAYVLPHKAAEFTFTNYLRRVENDFVELPDYEYIPMGMVNVGLFNRVGISAWGGDKLAFANLKLMLVGETPLIPQIAIGIDNLFSPVKEDALEIEQGEDYYDNPDKSFYEKNSPYIAITKAAVLRNMTGLKLLETFITAGWGMNKFKGQVEIARRFEGIFGSITVKPHKDLSITFENDGFNLNAGAAYSYKKFAFKISYVAIEEQENNRFGLSVSYLFDKYADPKRSWLDDDISSKESEIIRSPFTGREINANEDLLEELKKLREQREQAQKVLDDLRYQLQEMEEETE
ncbi:MAG: hypothetical protein R6V77_04105 [Candidatus Cloacimonadaceae bacterium]